eukprot:scaffold99138_cov30-Tisochrysis_lutea.AAC.2
MTCSSLPRRSNCCAATQLASSGCASTGSLHFGGGGLLNVHDVEKALSLLRGSRSQEQGKGQHERKTHNPHLPREVIAPGEVEAMPASCCARRRLTVAAMSVWRHWHHSIRA